MPSNAVQRDVICRLQEIYYGSKTKHFRQV